MGGLINLFCSLIRTVFVQLFCPRGRDKEEFEESIKRISNYVKIGFVVTIICTGMLVSMSRGCSPSKTTTTTAVPEPVQTEQSAPKYRDAAEDLKRVKGEYAAEKIMEARKRKLEKDKSRQ